MNVRMKSYHHIAVIGILKQYNEIVDPSIYSVFASIGYLLESPSCGMSGMVPLDDAARVALQCMTREKGEVGFHSSFSHADIQVAPRRTFTQQGENWRQACTGRTLIVQNLVETAPNPAQGAQLCPPAASWVVSGGTGGLGWLIISKISHNDPNQHALCFGRDGRLKAPIDLSLGFVTISQYVVVHPYFIRTWIRRFFALLFVETFLLSGLL